MKILYFIKHKYINVTSILKLKSENDVLILKDNFYIPLIYENQLIKELEHILIINDNNIEKKYNINEIIIINFKSNIIISINSNFLEGDVITSLNNGEFNNLNLKMLPNSFITTVRKIPGRKYSCAVYDSNGNLEQTSTGYDDGYFMPKDPIIIDGGKINNHINGNSVYIGNITHHYGHFITETLSRFWIFLDEYNFLKKLQIKNIIFNNWITGKYNVNSSDLNKNILSCIINIFKLKTYNIIILNKDVKVDKLYLPTRTCGVYSFSVIQQLVYNKIVQYALTNKSITHNYKYIYISRKTGIKRVDNENEIIEVFKSYNFYILDPTPINFLNDLYLYNNAHIIAGLDGTNIHNICFAQKNTTLINLYDTRRETSTNSIQRELNRINNINYYSINYKKKNNIKRKSFDIDYLKNELQKIMNIIINK